MKNCRAEAAQRRKRRGGFRLAAFLLACLTAPAALAQSPAELRVGEKVAAAPVKPPPSGVADLQWDDLMPKGWSARKALEGVDLASLSDNDPRASRLLDKLRQDLDRAPVVPALDGRRVRIAGFVVTLERSDKGVREFLLVPYFGACIHTPPPPANQIVHVLAAAPVPPEKAIFPVWVIGTLKTVAAVTAEGAAGYRIADAQVEEYPWRRRR
ncbi:MAG: DUF3299 domain-containing protein [Betaproteobacteria bacterium]|nr:DUF3299 domain-containing protein [Betaproteobacteria bacterium]